MGGKKDGRVLGFLMSVGLSLVMRLEWSIPAWILLALHFLRGWPILWFWLALAVWILPTLIRLAVIRWASACGSSPDPFRENKNPYSHKTDRGGKT